MPILPLLFAVLLLLLAGPVAADGPERLERFFRDVNAFDASFTQQVHDEKGEVLQTSSGRVLLQRPGRFRWDYEKPFSQSIVADGQYLWIYDADLAQVTVQEMGTALGRAPIALLSERRSLHEDFVVTAAAPREGLEWVDLRPRDRDTDFLRIEFGLDERAVRWMTLHDQFGQKTVIRFTDMKINPDLP
ncbi:MAG: outer membrane lipoprotein chaperone LolA, partial [Chromatiales bacterium]|nr:outer membrane lipoprotein chaperone LolA [Chromatiales bacterium]